MISLLSDSPLGILAIWGNGRAICAVKLGDYSAGSGDAGGGDPLLNEASRQLRQYFAGERREFDLPLHPAGTPFQCRVWDQLRRIPFGETISYGELARRVGNPAASRAVGAANGRNPIPIIVPCHRVIGSDGSMTGFGGGVERKRALLGLEAVGRGLLVRACS